MITNRERHPGSFDVVHVKDSTGNNFATRLSNIFVIGKVRGDTHSVHRDIVHTGTYIHNHMLRVMDSDTGALLSPGLTVIIS